MSGVSFEPPPRGLLADAMKIVEEQTRALPPGHRNAVVLVATDAGVNAAIVHRAGDHVGVTGWVGKRWGSSITGGGAVHLSW